MTNLTHLLCFRRICASRKDKISSDEGINLQLKSLPNVLADIYQVCVVVSVALLHGSNVVKGVKVMP